MANMLGIIMGILSYFTFFVNSGVIYLSFFDWYKREESIGAAFKISIILSGVLSIIIFILYMSPITILDVYRDILLTSFILSLVILYLYITWIRKRIYLYYHVATYLAYNVVLWFLFPLFYFYAMEFNVSQTLFASYLSAAILGTLLATAIIPEIRPKEILSKGIPSITTAIAITDMITGALSTFLPRVRIGVGGFSISVIHITVLFLSLLAQYFCYKHITGE